MLRAKAEIQFTLEGKNYVPDNQFRIAFNFGEGLIFSGTIRSNHTEYLQGEKYLTDVEFFTVEDEAYFALQPLLTKGKTLSLCAGKRILGVAVLHDYSYGN
jgi:hypothetical protein